jgi:hypothetical protein
MHLGTSTTVKKQPHGEPEQDNPSEEQKLFRTDTKEGRRSMVNPVDGERCYTQIFKNHR